MPYDCFISYASADLRLAEELHRQLEAEGFTVWFDKARLRTGCDWHREIEAGCEESRIVLPILTPRWKLSEWTKFETYGAECVFPILCEGDFTSCLTPPLTRWQAHTLPCADGGDVMWQRLFTALRERLAKPPPEKFQRLARVRYHTNPYFVGREKDLLAIHDELHVNPTAVLTQGHVRAIAALGGVGKTTLARQYIEKFWRLYPQIFWVDVRLGFESEFARIHDALFPERAASGLKDTEKAVSALQELNSRAERLLVLDNAEDEVSTQSWIPKTGGCRTLITSRFSGWSAAIKTIHLYVLDPGPARILLLTRAGRNAAALPATEREACDALAKELGYLPLALEQAAAYVGEQGEAFGFVEYLRLYRMHARELLAAGVLGSTEYPDSVITTWKATVAKLPPEARAILRLAAPLADAPLPISLLADSWHTIRECAAQLQTIETQREPPSVELAARQAASSLKRYSMAGFDGRHLLLHNLVQTVERLQTPPEQFESVLKQAERILARNAVVVAENYEHWDKWRTLLPHLCRLRQYTIEAGTDITFKLITGMVLFYLSQGKYAEAFRDAKDAFRLASQKNDFLTGASEANNVAVALSSMGRDVEALEWQDKALEIARKDLSEDHNLVLKFRATKATTLASAGRPMEAVALLDEILPIMEDRRSFDRMVWVKFKHRLAHIKIAAGETAAAVRLQRECFAYAEEHFGWEHPETILCAGGLGEMLLHGRALQEAEPLIRKAKDAADQVLGPEHPNTLDLHFVLAAFFHCKGDLAEAEARYRRVLEAYERVLGPENPRTLDSIGTLSLVLRDEGNLSEAELLSRQALDRKERVCGPTHPSTLDAVNGLGLILMAKAQLDEAETLFRRSLAAGEHVLGSEHPHTLHSMHNLAALLHKRGDLAGAEVLFRRRLTVGDEVLPRDNPETLSTIRGLAAICEQSGRACEAWSWYLAAAERQNGPEHSDTLELISRIATWYYERGDYTAAEPLDLRVAETRERILPVGHADVATSWFNYALLLRNMGRAAGAESRLRHALDLAEKAPVAFPPDSPAFAHWRTNLATLLILQGKLPDATTILQQCWTNQRDKRDVTTARILFLNYAIARLQNEAGAVYLRHLKAVLNGSELPVPAAASRVWRIPTVAAYLRERLPADAEFLASLLETINDVSKLSELDRFSVWRDAKPEPLV